MHLRLLARCLLRIARHRLALAKTRTRQLAFLPCAVNPGGVKRALLVHIVEPLSDASVDVRHQNRWQVREIARCLAERGYRVDALAPGGEIPAGIPEYDLVVDLHPGISRYPASRLRVAYITGSDPAFSNRAERARMESLRQRRGVRLKARRNVPEFRPADLEDCDAVFFMGNTRNLGTFSGFRLPITCLLRNFAYPVPPIPGSRSRLTEFLYLASGGQVHKGLDLLLDVFAGHPEWTLHICSPFHEEPDFCRAYARELFTLPNIIPHGFQRLDSPAFAAIAARCTFVVFPSCSEGLAGSVLSGMAAGLIPVVSRESGFDEDEAIIFPNCTHAEITQTLTKLTALSPAALTEASAQARSLVAERYSPAAFTASLDAAFDAIPGILPKPAKT